MPNKRGPNSRRMGDALTAVIQRLPVMQRGLIGSFGVEGEESENPFVRLVVGEKDQTVLKKAFPNPPTITVYLGKEEVKLPIIFQVGKA